jgi:hypothetical protein
VPAAGPHLAVAVASAPAGPRAAAARQAVEQRLPVEERPGPVRPRGRAVVAQMATAEAPAVILRKGRALRAQDVRAEWAAPAVPADTPVSCFSRPSQCCWVDAGGHANSRDAPPGVRDRASSGSLACAADGIRIGTRLPVRALGDAGAGPTLPRPARSGCGGAGLSAVAFRLPPHRWLAFTSLTQRRPSARRRIPVQD